MATQLQIRRGTTAQTNSFTGAEGELSVNTTTDTVHVHDGSTAGGHGLAKADGSNIATYAGSFTTLSASDLTVTGGVTSGAHLINASSSAFGSNSVQGFNTDFLVDSGQGFSRHNSYHTGGSNHQFLVNEAGSTTNAVAFSIAKDKSATFSVNVGIGRVPDTVYSGSLQLALGNGAQLATSSTGNTSVTIADNSYLNASGNHVYKTPNPSTNVEKFSSTLTFGNAASGTAGNTISYIERARLNSSGSLLLGKTAADSIGTAGIEIDGANDRVLITRAGGETLILNRQTNDGPILVVRKDGALVGELGSFNGVPWIGYAAGAGGGIMFNGLSIEPTGLGATRTAGTNDIGSSTHRWKDLYLSGGAFLGGTSAANKLTDFESGQWVPTIEGDGASTSGQAYGTRLSRYTKIGSFVFLTCDIGLNTLGSIAGSYATIKGLPFSVVTSHMGGGSVGYYSGINNNSGILTFYAAANQAYLMTGGSGYVARGDLTNTTRIICTIIYQTGQ